MSSYSLRARNYFQNFKEYKKFASSLELEPTVPVYLLTLPLASFSCPLSVLVLIGVFPACPTSHSWERKRCCDGPAVSFRVGSEHWLWPGSRWSGLVCGQCHTSGSEPFWSYLNSLRSLEYTFFSDH